MLNTLAQLGVTVLMVENFTRSRLKKGPRPEQRPILELRQGRGGAAFTAWPGGGGRRHPGGFLWLRPDSLIIEIIQQRFARFDIP